MVMTFHKFYFLLSTFGKNYLNMKNFVYIIISLIISINSYSQRSIKLKASFGADMNVLYGISAENNLARYNNGWEIKETDKTFDIGFTIGNTAIMHDSYLFHVDQNGIMRKTWMDKGIWACNIEIQPEGFERVAKPVGVVSAQTEEYKIPHVFIIDEEGRLQDYYWEPNDDWHWANMGYPPSGSRIKEGVAVINHENNPYAFVICEDDSLWNKHWNPNDRKWHWENQPISETVGELKGIGAINFGSGHDGGYEPNEDGEHGRFQKQPGVFFMDEENQIFCSHYSGEEREWKCEGLNSHIQGVDITKIFGASVYRNWLCLVFSGNDNNLHFLYRVETSTNDGRSKYYWRNKHVSLPENVIIDTVVGISYSKGLNENNPGCWGGSRPIVYFIDTEGYTWMGYNEDNENCKWVWNNIGAPLIIKRPHSFYHLSNYESNNNQIGSKNKNLDLPFKVMVRNSLGKPVADGTEVTFSSVEDGYEETVRTTNGKAHAYLKLSEQLGAQQYTASFGTSASKTFTAYCLDRNLHDERDGENYSTTMIGNKRWMAENLRLNWAGSISNPKAESFNGRIYTLEQVLNGHQPLTSSDQGNIQGICPNGWHLPSKQEWNDLISLYNDDQDKLRSVINWKAGNGTNLSKFNSFPSGMHATFIEQKPPHRITEKFKGLGFAAYYWSSTSRSNGWVEVIEINHENMFYNYGEQYVSHEKYSCRCIED